MRIIRYLRKHIYSLLAKITGNKNLVSYSQQEKQTPRKNGQSERIEHMFKLVTGGNGRTIYLGTVTQHNDKAMEIAGKEWNPDTKQEEEKKLQMYFDKSISEKGKLLKVGDQVVVSYLPGKDEKSAGRAEEIARAGEVISITNDRGNKKYVIFSKVHKKKWNDKNTMLRLVFRDLKDTNGNFVGNPYTFTDDYDNTYTNYWLNVSIFPANEKFKNAYNAKKADKDIEAGDIIVMVATMKTNAYNGKEYTNYNGAKFTVLEKNDKNDSNQASGQQSSNTSVTGGTAAAQPDNNMMMPDGFDDEDLDDLPFN